MACVLEAPLRMSVLSVSTAAPWAAAAPALVARPPGGAPARRWARPDLGLGRGAGPRGVCGRGRWGGPPAPAGPLCVVAGGWGGPAAGSGPGGLRRAAGAAVGLPVSGAPLPVATTSSQRRFSLQNGFPTPLISEESVPILVRGTDSPKRVFTWWHDSRSSAAFPPTFLVPWNSRSAKKPEFPGVISGCNNETKVLQRRGRVSPGSVPGRRWRAERVLPAWDSKWVVSWWRNADLLLRARGDLGTWPCWRLLQGGGPTCCICGQGGGWLTAATGVLPVGGAEGE